MEETACKPGMEIHVHGLVSAAHLNGMPGICERWDEETGRWIVQMQDGVFRKLRPVNCGVQKNLETVPWAEEVLSPARTTADTIARLVLRASCLAQMASSLSEFVQPDGIYWVPNDHHKHFYEPLSDLILPVFGLKGSFQTEATKLDNLTFVAGVSGMHAYEIVHGDAVMSTLLKGSAPHLAGNHAMALGLFFLSGTSAWAVRSSLPYVEKKDEDETDSHANDESGSEGSYTDTESSFADEFEGFVEDCSNTDAPGSSADPYPEVAKDTKGSSIS